MYRETKTEYGWNLVENEGGKTLGYCPESGTKIIEKDGLAFKDLAKTGELLPYEDWRLSAEDRAEDLAKRLTVKQIAGLMCYSVHQVMVGAELNKDQIDFLTQNVRSVLNATGLAHVPNEVSVPWVNTMQKFAESQPMGIPCYFATDPRNGIGVSDWPGNLSLAATFDPAIAKESAKCQSIELRDLGCACFLAPQVDIGSDPRWFRFSGTFGEDPALSRDMVRAFCDGLQSTYDADGNDLGWGKDSMTAMVKHWTGEGAGEGGREAHLEMGKYAVYPNNNFEALMIPFVDGAFQLEGKTKTAAAVMSSYTAAWSEDGSLGDIVGSSFSKYKIKELLRGRFQFKGVVCTDWMVLNEGKAQGIRSCGWGVGGIEDENVNPAENALKCILAGVDQMGGCSHPAILVEAYNLGCEKYGKDLMDEVFATSAKRLLLGYFLTGMFENPYIDEKASLADVNSADKQKAAFDAQLKAIVMLKNKGNVIKAGTGRKKVYVPATFIPAHDTFSHHAGTAHVEDTAVYQIKLSVLEKYFDVVADTIEGTTVTRASDEAIATCDLVLIPAKAPELTYAQGDTPDKVFKPLTIQYRPYTADGPHVRKVSIAGDMLSDGTKQNRSYFGQTNTVVNELQLDQILDAAAKAKKAGIPSVVCMFADKPLCFHEFEKDVDAILVTFSSPSLYGGSDTSAEALSQVVAGMAEPNALLPMQMPKDMDDVEQQCEDTPRDMACYTDSEGHTYDFAFGMNYAGVINDQRVQKYKVPALTKPAR